MIPATTGSNSRITAARAGSTNRCPQSCSVNASALQHDAGDRGRDEHPRRDVTEAADRDDRNREHGEHRRAARSERDRVEVLREVRRRSGSRAPKRNAHASVSASPACKRNVDPSSRKRPDHRAHRPRSRRCSDGRRRVTAVSISGVNTTNKPGDERGVRRGGPLQALRSGTSSRAKPTTPNASTASRKSLKPQRRARRRRAAPPVADRERQQHGRAHREPQQDEPDRA